MADVSGYLPNLIGPVVIAAGGVAQTPRPTINFVGCTGADNPTFDRLDITPPAGGGGGLPVTRTRRAIAAPSTITVADDLIEQTAAAATATLPAAPSDGHEYEVNNNTSGDNDVGGNGHNINVTGSGTMTLGPRQAVTFTWSSTSTEWLAT